MRSLLVYLAGAIDHVEQGQARGWREQASSILTRRGHSTFSPAHAFHLGENSASYVADRVIRLNAEALRACDALLANLSLPSIGTGIEVEMMRREFPDKPVVCFGGNPSSLYVQTWHHVAVLEEAIDEIERLATDGSEHLAREREAELLALRRELIEQQLPEEARQ